MSIHTGYIIGADGGGTKTAMVLAGRDGREIGRLTAGPSNPTDLGESQSAEFLTETALELCGKCGVAPSEIAAIFFGIAGGSNELFRTLCKKSLKAAFPQSRTGVLHDAVNIVYASFPDSDGVAIICGTGCSCFVKKGEKLHRIGGYSIFDITGNGYEIGKRAISHALACYDGRAERDLLSAPVEERVGEDLIKALPRLLSANKNEIARYAPLVFDAEEKGCREAHEIIVENIARIAEYINASKRYFNASFCVSIAGGIFKSPRSMELLLPMVRVDCRISVLDREPVLGAVKKAETLLTNE